MTHIPALPFGLEPDDTVLYVAPYDPAEISEASAKPEYEQKLREKYSDAAQLRYIMDKLVDRVETVINTYPLKAAEIFDDLIIIVGHTDNLEKAQDILEADYKCNMGCARDVFDMLAAMNIDVTDPGPASSPHSNYPLAGPPPGVTIH